MEAAEVVVGAAAVVADAKNLQSGIKGAQPQQWLLLIAELLR